jgi:hypothetical protein
MGEATTPTEQKCNAEAAGYDGMFGVYCELPAGHLGPHNDGFVEWDFVDPDFRNSDDPAWVARQEEKQP